MKTQTQTPQEKTLTIIGAGIIGVCSAWHLHKAGFKVTVIDATDPAVKTSYGNAGCISPTSIVPFAHPKVLKELPQWLLQPHSPLSIKWHHLFSMYPWLKQFVNSGTAKNLPLNIHAAANLMASVHSDWADITQQTDTQHLIEKKGVIKLFDHAKQLHEHQWSLNLMHANGYTYDTVAGQDLQSLEPHLKVTPEMLGLYFSSWQHIINPQKIIQAIAQHCIQAGVSFVKHTVQSIAVQQNKKIKITTTTNKNIYSEACLVAAGVWSNQLAQQMDYSVPLLPKRGYHVHFPDAGLHINHPILPMNDYVIMTPMNTGLRIAGTAEFDALDAPPDYRRADDIAKRSLKYFPQANTQHATQWMGQRPMLPDSLPIISRSPKYENIFYAFGHGHSGITQGPTTGRLISELILQTTPSIDLSSYRFARFTP